MSVAEKLNTINNIKQDIKAALEYKGLTVTDQFDTYAEQIRSLGNADSSEDPFASIGYYKFEQMPWQAYRQTQLKLLQIVGILKVLL